MSNMDKDSVSMPDKIMSILIQLYDFVNYEIENTNLVSISQDIIEQVNTVFQTFNEKFEMVNNLIKETETESALIILQSSEPAFWMFKAYKTIELMQDQKIKKLCDDKCYKDLINSIMSLCGFMTLNCYQNCLIVHDQEIEIKEGGVIYIDKSGIIAGYSKYVYDNQEVISDDPTALYLFKNICELHSSLNINLSDCLNSDEALKYAYFVPNPYNSSSKSNLKIEECKGIEFDGNDSGDDKQIYVLKWKKYEELKVTLEFKSVYYSFFVKTQKITDKTKMRGFRVKVTIDGIS